MKERKKTHKNYEFETQKQKRFEINMIVVIRDGMKGGRRKGGTYKEERNERQTETYIYIVRKK